MSFATIWLVLNVFVFSATVTLCVLNWRQWRKTVLLSDLLQTLCTQAYTLRHAPIWVSWMEATGIRVRIVVEPPRVRDRIDK